LFSVKIPRYSALLCATIASVKILFLSAEVAPFVSVGGLSQVMYFLPRSLQKKGHSVRIFTAKHGAMEETRSSKKPWDLKTEIPRVDVPTTHAIDKTRKSTSSVVKCSILSFSKAKQPKTFFLENSEYFEMRANVFSYKDDHVRFALLSKGCLEWLKRLKESSDDWWPDVIHANDWHTGYFIDLARNDKRYQRLLAKVPVVYTIHNFFYQGNMNFRYLAPNLRDKGADPLVPLLSPKLLRQNALLRGILNADEINTVSPTHAIEVLTPEYAEGLEDVLTKARSKITGILNGLDTKEFDPSTDPIIKHKYNSSSFLSARAKNKIALQKEFNLKADKTLPIIAVCGRISAQKGWELILEALPKLLSERPDLQFIVLGQGDERYQNELANIQREFPDQLALHLRTDFRLPRKIYSGADMILIPSIFEPGGIVALEAMRYGAVPIVRRTGGLNDIVKEFNPNRKTGTGFSFVKKNSWSLFSAIVTSLTIYQQPESWNKLVKNCLMADFSWDYSGTQYITWYERAIEERKRATSITPHPAYKPVGIAPQR